MSICDMSFFFSLDGGAIDQIFARTTSTSVTAWYLSDQLGSVRDET